MPSFNQKNSSRQSDQWKSHDNSITSTGEKKVYRDIDFQNQDNSKITPHKPFMWSLKAAEDVYSAPLYRTLPRPQINNSSSGQQQSNVAKIITSDGNIYTSTRQEKNDNAMLNTTLKPPKGTPPVIFDSDHITETKMLQPATENIYKQVKGTYTSTNTKFRPKYSLSPNSKSRIFIQNDLFNKSKTSLDPSNLPSKQHFIPLNYSHFFKKGSIMRMKLEKKLTVKLSDDNHKRNSAIRMKSKGALPPPGQASQLIEIIDKMITFISTLLFKDIQNLIAYATKYREYINTNFHTNSRNITIRNVNCKVNYPSFASIVQKAHNQLQTALIPIDMTASNMTNNRSNNHHHHPNRPSTASQANNMTNHYDPSIDESSFIHILILFCGLPNHRPIPEMSIVLMWFFSELSESTGIQLWEAHNQSTFQFNKYSKSIRQSLKLLTIFHTDRNGAEDVLKYEKDHKIQAEETLKSWYTNQYKIFEKSSSSSSSSSFSHVDDQSLNQSMNQMSVSSQSKSVGSHINQHRHLTYHNNNIYNPNMPSSSSSSSSYHQPQPPSGSSRPSTAGGGTGGANMVSPGYRPVSSQPQAMRLDMTTSPSGVDKNKYPKHSVSPGHLRSITNNSSHPNDTNSFNQNSFNNAYNNDFSSSLLSSTSIYNNESSQSQIASASSGFESVLVKVLSHKGLDSFLIAMNWVPLTMASGSSSSSKSINNDSGNNATAYTNKALLACANRVTRCKHTENTSSTYVINSDIGQMVNQSLRAFGAGVLVDDILEDPPPPQSILYQPIMTIEHHDQEVIDNSKSNNKVSNRKNENKSNTRERRRSVTSSVTGDHDRIANNTSSSSSGKDKGSSSRRGSVRSNSNSPSKLQQLKAENHAISNSNAVNDENEDEDDNELNNDDENDDNDISNDNDDSKINRDDASSTGSVAFGGSDTDDNFAIEDALMMADDPLQSIPSTWISPTNVDSSAGSGKAKSKNRKKPKLNFIKANKQAPVIKTSRSDNTDERRNTNNRQQEDEDMIDNQSKSKSKLQLPNQNKPKSQKQSSSSSSSIKTTEKSDDSILSLIKRIVLKSNSSSFEESLKYLYKCGPRLENKQCLMICMSLLSDYARTIILGIMVLVKHAWAGKELDMAAVQAVLGGPFCRALLGIRVGGVEEGRHTGVNSTSSSSSSTTLLQELLQWLQANRHTSATFKVANQTQTETALQNLFSFWSELMMSDFTKDSTSDTKHTSSSDGININPREKCCVRLVWPHKYKVHKIFREPHTFIPNMNVI